MPPSPTAGPRQRAVFLQALAGTLNLPPWAVVTKLQCRPHIRNQFELTFTPMERVGSADVIRAIKARLPDMTAYRKFLGERLLALPGVKETRTYAVMEEVKRDAPLPVG